ncbi:MAG: nitroreductase/quinone reductase family protein [Mycetocola sp.]
MTTRTTLTDAGMRAMNAVHRALLAVSGGRVGWRLGRMVVLELHTVGRSSGLRRSTMLTAPLHRDGRFVLVASKGGDDRDPQWYKNLCDEPEVDISVRGTTGRYRARTAPDVEKQELWPEIVASYRGYAAYQRRTSRNIPVVICEPIDANSTS